MISKHIFTSDVVSGKQLWINGLNSTGDLIVASTNFDIENNLKVGEDLSIGGNSVLSGNANISGDLYVGQNLTVKGTTTTLDTVNVTVDDHNIELGSVDNPTNITAEGGGITLKGDQDKTFNWQANYNGSWLSSENLGVADGKYVFTDKVRARDGAGLLLEDDGGNGIFIEDGGNVGIGTTSPDYKLHITGGTPAMKLEGPQPRIWLRETDQTDLNTLIRNNNSIFEIDTVSDTDAYIQNRFAINHANGNVRINDLLGIGKDPDGYHLDVAAPGASANGIRVQTNNASANAIVHIGSGGSADIKFKVDGEGSVTTAKDVAIGGNLTVNGTTTTVNSTTLTVDDKNIELGSVASPTNTTAEGGGITLKGATDKEFKWGAAADAWRSNVNLEVSHASKAKIDLIRTATGGGVGGIELISVGNTAAGINNRGGLIDLTTPSDGTAGPTLRFGTRNGTTEYKTLYLKDGKVGIGADSPEEPLDVRGSIKTKNDGDNSEVKLVSSGGMPYINFKRGSSADWKIKAKGNGSQQVLTTSLGTSDLITVQADGNVGIGTIIPDHKLHIVGGTPSMKLEGSQPRIWLSETDQTDLNTLIRNNGSLFQIDTATDADAFVANRLTINHTSGNVGIGTTTPSAKLEISQPATTIGGNDLTKGCILLGSSAEGVAIDNNEIIKKGPGATSDFVIGNANSAGDILLRTNQADRVIISNNSTIVSNNLVADGGVVISTNEDNDTPELTLRRTSSTNASGTDDIVDIRVADSALNFIINNDSDGDGGTYQFQKMAGGLTVPAAINCDTITTNGIIRKNGDTNTYLEFHSADRLRLVTGGVQQLEVTNSGLFIQDNIKHTGDDNTYFGFHNPDQWRVVTGGSERLEVTNTAIALKRDTAITGGLTISGNLTVTGKTITNDVEVVSTSNGVVFEGSVADDHEGLLKAGALTADRTYTLPNQSGTVAMTSDIKNSAITITAGNALTGGGTLNLNQSSAETITINHQDTSTASSVNNSGRTYIQDIGLDGYGHVTSLASATASNATVTVTAGGAMTGGGSFTLDGTGGTITLNHQDTSSQGSSNNSGRTYIQDISLDAYGHVTSIGTATETVVDTNTTYSTATSSTAGLVKIGYSENGKNYPVELSSGKMFVNVPWVDTDTNTQRTDAEIRTAVGGSFPTFGAAQDGKVLKVNSSGNLEWGTDNAGAGATNPGGANTQVQFNNNGSFGGSANLTFDGTNLSCAGDVVSYASSDKKLKNNISNISSPIEKIKQINGVNFEWSEKQSVYTGKDVGVLAQDVEKVLPEVVSEREDGYLAVKYEKIIPLLIEAIKDQQKEIEELKSKLS